MNLKLNHIRHPSSVQCHFKLKIVNSFPANPAHIKLNSSPVGVVRMVLSRETRVCQSIERHLILNNGNKLYEKFTFWRKPNTFTVY